MIDKKDKPPVDPKETAEHSVVLQKPEGTLPASPNQNQQSPEKRLSDLLKRSSFPDHEATEILRELIRKVSLDDNQPIIALTQRLFSVGDESAALHRDNELVHLALQCLAKFCPQSSIVTPVADIGMYSDDAHVQGITAVLIAKQMPHEEALGRITQHLNTCDGHAVDSIFHALLSSPEADVRAVGQEALRTCERAESRPAKSRFLKAA